MVFLDCFGGQGLDEKTPPGSVYHCIDHLISLVAKTCFDTDPAAWQKCIEGWQKPYIHTYLRCIHSTFSR